MSEPVDAVDAYARFVDMLNRSRFRMVCGRGTATYWKRDRGEIDFVFPEPANPLQKRARKQAARVTMTAELRFHLLEAKAGALTDHVIEWDGAAVASIRKGFAEACKRAGLTGVVPHTLRHTAATWALESGVEVERISRQLGHRMPAWCCTIC